MGELNFNDPDTQAEFKRFMEAREKERLEFEDKVFGWWSEGGTEAEGAFIEYLTDMVKGYLDELDLYLPAIFDYHMENEDLAEEADPATFAEKLFDLFDQLREKVLGT